MFMRFKLLLSYAMCTIILATIAPSCAHLPFIGDRSESTDTSVEAEDRPAESVEVASVDEGEATLRRMVTNSVDKANAGHDAARAELVRREPYFFKQYEYYPDGTTFMDVSTRETESRTAPRVADVQLRKQRFVTQLHRKKDEARADNDFLRDTGDETRTYELRNGKWKRVSSLFVAESVDRMVDGTWMPVEEIERTDDVDAEEDLGWFGRIWSNVVGR